MLKLSHAVRDMILRRTASLEVIPLQGSDQLAYKSELLVPVSPFIALVQEHRARRLIYFSALFHGFRERLCTRNSFDVSEGE